MHDCIDAARGAIGTDRHIRGYRYFWAMVASAPLLCACAQPLPPPAPKPVADLAGKAAKPVTNEKPARIVVRFRTVVPYQDPAFLQGVAQQIQAQLSYVASVSSDTHVYLLQPLPGQSSADALKRLVNLPAVLWAEPDRIATPF